jgi:hypothetical protein
VAEPQTAVHNSHLSSCGCTAPQGRVQSRVEWPWVSSGPEMYAECLFAWTFYELKAAAFLILALVSKFCILV